MKLNVEGAVGKFFLYCVICNHSWRWQTVGQTPTDAVAQNAMLTGSVLYTGSQPNKVAK